MLKTWRPLAALGVLSGLIVLPGIPRSHAADEQPAGKTLVAVTLGSEAPKGAIVLVGGKTEDITSNWYRRSSKDPAGWTVDANGVASPDKNDMITKQEFGDSYVHAEFRCPADANGKPITGGNSGVAFQGRYEIQILNSYGRQPEKHECGALYDEKPPVVIASKKPGEWQTYDIIFRAPRFDADGKVTEKARATVFQNGVLVQNNEEFTGPTGIQYGEYKGEVKTGPLLLQGNHDPVQFRNVWIVPM